MNFPENLLYSKDHEWLLVEGDQGRIGISDYAQHQLGDIVYIELPEIGTETDLDTAIGVIESVKAVATILSPVEGTIADVNEDLEESPELLNEAPYENWIAIIDMSVQSTLDKLMNAQAYAEYCATLKESEV